MSTERKTEKVGHKQGTGNLSCRSAGRAGTRAAGKGEAGRGAGEAGADEVMAGRKMWKAEKASMGKAAEWTFAARDEVESYLNQLSEDVMELGLAETEGM